MQRNGTTFGDEVSNSHTGELDFNLVNQAHSFNGETQTHFKRECGQIKGSGDGFFPPFTIRKSGGCKRKNMPQTVPLLHTKHAGNFSHEIAKSWKYYFLHVSLTYAKSQLKMNDTITTRKYVLLKTIQ